MNRYILPISVLIALAVGIVIAVMPQAFSKNEPITDNETGSIGAGEKGAKRVVCITLAGVEMIYALGAGERLVGRADYLSWPPEAEKIPKVGGWMNTNFEVITTLKPDLLIIQGQTPLARKFAKRRALKLISLSGETVDGILEDISMLGLAMGLHEEAAALRAKIRYNMELIAGAVHGKPRRTVLLVTARQADSIRQISTVGGDTFLSDILKTAGGDNIFTDMTFYPTVSREKILDLKPEFIIELRTGEEISAERLGEIKAEYNPMQSLPAVRSGRVFIVNWESAQIAGPRIDVLARKLAEILHPEVDWDEIDRAGNKRK